MHKKAFPTLAAAIAGGLVLGVLPASAAPVESAYSLNWCAWPNTSGGEREYHVTLGATIKDRVGPNATLRIDSVSVVAPNGETAPYGQEMRITVRVTRADGPVPGNRSGSFQVNSTTTVIPKSMGRPLTVPDADFYAIEVTKARVGKVSLSCVLAP